MTPEERRLEAAAAIDDDERIDELIDEAASNADSDDAELITKAICENSRQLARIAEELRRLRVRIGKLSLEGKQP